MSVYQRCKIFNLAARACSLGLFLSFSVTNSSLLSILFTVGRLLHSSIQNNFTLFSKCYSIPVFTVQLQFLSFQSIEIDNCYIYILYMLTFKFILICHLFVFPNLSVILTSVPTNYFNFLIDFPIAFLFSQSIN